MTDLLKAAIRVVYRCWLEVQSDVLLERHHDYMAECERERAER